MIGYFIALATRAVTDDSNLLFIRKGVNQACAFAPYMYVVLQNSVKYSLQWVFEWNDEILYKDFEICWMYYK